MTTTMKCWRPESTSLAGCGVRKTIGRALHLGLHWALAGRGTQAAPAEPSAACSGAGYASGPAPALSPLPAWHPCHWLGLPASARPGAGGSE